MMTPEELAVPPAVRSFWRWREYYKGVAEAGRWTADQLSNVIREIEGRTGSPDRKDLEVNPQPMENRYDLAAI